MTNQNEIPELAGFAEPEGIKKGRAVDTAEWQEVFFGSVAGRRVLGDILILTKVMNMPAPGDPADVGRRAVGIEILTALGAITQKNLEEDRIVAAIEAMATGASDWLRKRKSPNSR